MKKEVAKDLTDAAGKALTPSQGEGGSPSDSSPDSGSCDLNDGPPTSLCSTALSSDNTMSSDTGVEYKQVEANANGKVYEVTYNGEGPGITDQYKDQQVNYSDTARIQVDSNGNITILGWNKPVETPIGN